MIYYDGRITFAVHLRAPALRALSLLFGQQFADRFVECLIVCAGDADGDVADAPFAVDEKRGRDVADTESVVVDLVRRDGETVRQPHLFFELPQIAKLLAGCERRTLRAP